VTDARPCLTLPKAFEAMSLAYFASSASITSRISATASGIVNGLSSPAIIPAASAAAAISLGPVRDGALMG
jgi:hypothetical protein